jgi:SAM-dependent methyltransferase
LDSSSGQQGLEDHYEKWFAQIETDFRANSLNELIVSLTPMGRVLDIGCGSGALSAELLAGGREVLSQDMSERMVAMCRKHLEHRGIHNGSVRLGVVDDIQERKHFDAVIALDVIEHIEDDVAALERMREALRPDGTLILSVPALSALYGPKDEAVGHYRRYDKAQLLETMRRAGFEPQWCRYWNLLGVPIVWLSNLRGKRLDESVRYSTSPVKRALNASLHGWFKLLENPLRPPIGMTLICTAKPR